MPTMLRCCCAARPFAPRSCCAFWLWSGGCAADWWPLEVYELTDKVTILRLVAFLVNVVAVIYLLLAKRLFGLRGGRERYEADRHEQSLLEVEVAAATSAPDNPGNQLPADGLRERRAG